MKKIYLLSFLMVIVGISCEKETVITISNESFEEYFPYHENGKSYNEPFRYVGEDKNGDPIWRSLYEIEESINRCTIEFSNKNHYINFGEIPSLSILQEWNYLKERPQNYGVDAFHIVAYFTFTYENINGNYYIKGKKEMLIEGQKQEIIISGVIRPYDISSDNSINSSQPG